MWVLEIRLYSGLALWPWGLATSSYPHQATSTIAVSLTTYPTQSPVATPLVHSPVDTPSLSDYNYMVLLAIANDP